MSRIVPWGSWKEWAEVRDQLLSGGLHGTSALKLGIQRVSG